MLICQLSAIPIKILEEFFEKWDKIILNSYEKQKVKN